MFSMKPIVLLLSAAAVMPLAAGLPTNDTELDLLPRGDFWAMFCDDTDCSQNCGQSVEVSNPGCLNQNGRQSIRFHGSEFSSDYSLVVSPSADCPCQ